MKRVDYVEEVFPHVTAQQNFEEFAGQSLALAEDAPQGNEEFLRHHRKHVFH